MILKFQEEIPFAKDLFQLQRSEPGLLIEPFLNIFGHDACQTGAERNDTLMILPKHFHIHPRLVIKAFGKPSGNQLH